jgi:hypothetical protein
MSPLPTVGRIVHYNAPANDEYAARTLAALITKVNDDGTVALCCFGPFGFGFRDNVTEGDQQSTWHWPPRA